MALLSPFPFLSLHLLAYTHLVVAFTVKLLYWIHYPAEWAFLSALSPYMTGAQAEIFNSAERSYLVRERHGTAWKFVEKDSPASELGRLSGGPTSAIMDLNVPAF